MKVIGRRCPFAHQIKFCRFDDQPDQRETEVNPGEREEMFAASFCDEADEQE